MNNKTEVFNAIISSLVSLPPTYFLLSKLFSTKFRKCSALKVRHARTHTRAHAHTKCHLE